TPGDGRNETLTLLFDRPVRIVKVGLIPGYAKYDPVSAANRFEQDRIIKRVRYLIPAIAPRTQTFKAKPWPQFITLSATTSSLRLPKAVRQDLGRQAARSRARGGKPGRNLEDRTRQDLYEVAKRKDIPGRSRMGKWDLIKAIRKSS